MVYDPASGCERPARRVRQRCRSGVRLIGFVFLLTFGASAAQSQPSSFERDAWPILAVHCTGCHGAEEPKGGLDVRTVASLARGGDSGPALVPGDPAASLLVEKITSGDMPPKGQRKLSSTETATLTAWIRGGAMAQDRDRVPPPISPVSEADRRFWSFRPLTASGAPAVKQALQVRTPVDAFLLARLEAKQLAFSAEADPATLVRRAHLDLLGIPPTPEEVDAFENDTLPDRFERLVDRLLASPHFGERMGRHWLDVAGYVDTIGFDTDATNILLSEGKWRYRDYVIAAFNQDKPYDRFVREQLAGDEIYDWRRAARFTPEIREALIATGFLRTARDLTHEDVGVIQQNFFGIVHDTLEIVGTGLLGLTLNCARCHSHKFDPIPQEDYYRLMATLTPAYNPHAWRTVVATETKEDQQRVLADVSPAEQAEIERHNATLDRRLGELRAAIASLRQPHQTRLFEERLAALPMAIREDVRTALASPADKRNEVQKYLAGKFSSVSVKQEDVTAALSEAERAEAAKLSGEIAATEARRRRWGTIQALYDVGPPPETRLLVRGSESTPGPMVPAGFLRVLCRTEDAAVAREAAVPEGTSGRRTAQWLTEPDSPAAALLARVMVNRLWQQLYGRGIVATPDDFGLQGQAPSHPELLEWLSARFIAGGWRVKPLVRLMMESAAYRQTSHPAAVSGTVDPESIDPGNELLWRMRLRRLESEVVRDSVLAVSGKLNRKAGGPPVMLNSRPDGMVVIAQDKLGEPADACRRSIYLLTRRAYNLSLLTVFEQPLVATNCLRRDESAVPLQSLVMLNDATIAAGAEDFAARVESIAASPVRVEVAFRLALARRPNAQEAGTCADLSAQQAELGLRAGLSPEVAAHQALVQLCHTLLNTGEFLYVE